MANKVRLKITNNTILKDEIRNDSQGLGHFGAPRGSRTHKGIDILVPPVMTVQTPLAGTITKYGYTSSTATGSRYVEVTPNGVLGTLIKLRFHYVTIQPNLQVGTKLQKNETLGRSQNLHQWYSTQMKNHVHFELWLLGKRINPLILFKF